MAINLTGGELYIVGEVDPKTGADNSFVKIGIVRENENRSTDQRIKEHQTGNPRRLSVRSIVKTAMVERVETALHDQFAPLRISGEWFHMDATQVEEVVSVAKAMAKDASKKNPLVQQADALRKVLSDGNILTADKESMKLYRSCVEADAALKLCSAAAAATKAALAEAHSSKVDVSDFLRVVKKEGTVSIDQEALEAQHPKIWARFLVTKERISQRFTLASAGKDAIDVAAVAPDLFARASEISRQAARAAAKRTALEKLHRSFLELVALQSPIEWRRDLAEEELRARCGTSAGIEGICKWQRTMTESTSFDTVGFRKAHPDLADRFEVRKPGSTAFIVAKDRNYRL